MKRRTTVTAALAAIPLTMATVAACGSQSGSPTVGAGQPTSGSRPGGQISPQTIAKTFAGQLLDRVAVPGGAVRSGQAPTKALDSLPTQNDYVHSPTVLKRFWTLDMSATEAYAWFSAHGPNLATDGSGSTSTASQVTMQFRSYSARAADLPTSLAVGDVYVAVVPLSPTRSAIGAYAVTLPTPVRAHAEIVPTPDTVVLAWRIAAGGTPAQRTLTGAAAATLTKEFDALPVSVQAGAIPCPLQVPDSQVTLTFTAGTSSWHASVASCPGITVSHDGTALARLVETPGFVADLKRLGAIFPGKPGGVTPLIQQR